MLTFNLPSQCSQFFECHRRFFFIRRFAMPVIIIFKLFDAFAGNRASEDDGWFFKNSLCQIDGVNDFRNIVAVNLLHVPIKCAPLIGERFKRHDVFGIAIDLDVVAVNDCDQVAQFFFTAKENCFPGITFIVFAVRK